MRGFALFWAGWIVLALAVESWALFNKARGDTLTEFVRAYIISSPWGYLLIGAFLLWLVFHWLAVRSGVGWADLIIAIAGGVLAIWIAALTARAF